MVMNTTNNKPLHQQFSELDNEIFSAFVDTFTSVTWIADFKDDEDNYCPIDLQLTGKTNNREDTFDVELKSVHLHKWLDYCFFQADKWYSLLQFDNNKKLYIAIYPNHNKIAIWNVNKELLETSERDYQTMKSNTCNGDNTKTKLVYKFKLSNAKVFNFDLSRYKIRYNALYKQRSKNI